MDVRRCWSTVVGLCVLVLALSVAAGSAVAAPLFGGPQGSEAGEVYASDGLTVDRATGDVYVSDFFNSRVDQFEGSGAFVRAWGWGVLNDAEELQTCTVSCVAGRDGSGAGEFSQSAQGVAVDNEADGSSGDVYVVDFSSYRVQKFGPEGRFLLMFGGHVNQAKDGSPSATEAEKDVCVAGEACTAGTEGTADGEFEGAVERAYIAVGPGGRVYVGDRARVQVFEPSGAWRENISLAGLSATGKVTALAVNALGDVYVKDSEVAGVREFEPGGIESALPLDAGSETVRALSVDAAGDVFVEDTGGGVHFLEYGPGGEELSNFGSKVLTFASSITFDEASGELLVYGNDGSPSSLGVWGIAVPPVGPLIDGDSATGEPRGAVTFQASVDPEGNETSVVFQYVDEAQYQTSGFAGASSTAPVSIGSGFEDQPVEVKLPVKTLVPGVSYHWRVVAKDTASHTSTSREQAFQEVPAALVEGPWAANVAASSATLAAQVDPLGVSTEYRLEWGTSPSYGHTFSGNLGEGTSSVAVGVFHIQNLEPGTTYHYRLVTTSEAGTIESADHTFTTQLVQAQLNLPDGRAWELVSPASKQGAQIEPFAGYTDIQAAAGGGAIAYMANNTLGEGAAGKEPFTEVYASRGVAGWSNQDIAIPHSLPPEGTSFANALSNGVLEYHLFSPDLSLAVVEQPPEPQLRLSSEATERTPYLRNTQTCGVQPGSCYTPLITPKDVEPAGAKFASSAGNDSSEAAFAGGTPDLSHVIVESPYALAKGAVAEFNESGGIQGPLNLYEWNGSGGGDLKLVNVMPDGDTHPGVVGPEGACLGICGRDGKVVAHTVSSDGRWVVWSYGSFATNNGGANPMLFVRDMVGEKTVQIGGRHAEFQTMSSDGSRIFYRENGELYEFSTGTDIQVDLTAGHGAGEASAGVRDAILGASEDDSYVYFVATGALASGASSGADNLYVLHDGASGWNTTFIATLTQEDEQDWFNGQEQVLAQLSRVSSRVSPKGRFVTFMSSSPLTGYDNRDALSGRPDEEVFLYDAVANRLVCASCDPTGARPTGVVDEGIQNGGGLLVDRRGAWSQFGSVSDQHSLAGFIPGWDESISSNDSYWPYQPRYLSDSGRLFFESPDGLVPQATNGLMDVYEYEPVGVGDCSGTSVGFSVGSAGCVNLISTGTGNSESAFLDASESGDDVFFVTASRLVPEDYDTSFDVYDARVCSAESPCHVAAAVPPPCSSGDSCKAAPAPQPTIFGAAPSATFSGTGNVIEEAKPIVKHKSKKPKKPKKRRKPKRQKRPKGGKAKRSGRSVVSSGKGGRR